MRGRYSGFGALRFAYAHSVFYSLTSSNPSTSTKPRNRNQRATASTASQSTDTGSANRRSERLRHAQQRTATVNTLAMHMLQLYITQWHILSSLTPVVTIIHGEWTHWSGIADCTTVIQHWASTYQQQHSMNNIHVRHHTSLYVYNAFIRNNYYRRTHIRQNRHTRCVHERYFTMHSQHIVAIDIAAWLARRLYTDRINILTSIA